ncbi:MAG: hypothetical protein NXI08_09355 [bacterium]|nr:hypothetical protein [bacterium]
MRGFLLGFTLIFFTPSLQAQGFNLNGEYVNPSPINPVRIEEVIDNENTFTSALKQIFTSGPAFKSIRGNIYLKENNNVAFSCSNIELPDFVWCAYDIPNIELKFLVEMKEDSPDEAGQILTQVADFVSPLLLSNGFSFEADKRWYSNKTPSGYSTFVRIGIMRSPFSPNWQISITFWQEEVDFYDDINNLEIPKTVDLGSYNSSHSELISLSSEQLKFEIPFLVELYRNIITNDDYYSSFRGESKSSNNRETEYQLINLSIPEYVQARIYSTEFYHPKVDYIFDMHLSITNHIPESYSYVLFHLQRIADNLDYEIDYRGNNRRIWKKNDSGNSFILVGDEDKNELSLRVIKRKEPEEQPIISNQIEHVSSCSIKSIENSIADIISVINVGIEADSELSQGKENIINDSAKSPNYACKIEVPDCVECFVSEVNTNWTQFLILKFDNKDSAVQSYSKLLREIRLNLRGKGFKLDRENTNVREKITFKKLIDETMTNFTDGTPNYVFSRTYDILTIGNYHFDDRSEVQIILEKSELEL